LVEQNTERQPALKSGNSIAVILLLLLTVAVTLVAVQGGGEEHELESQGSQAASVNVPLSSEPATALVEASNADEHALDPVLSIARDALVSMKKNVRDYQATLLKRERIGGSLSGESVMEIKVINPSEAAGEKEAVPMHVYLKFTAPASSKGREVIWIEGRNNNQIVAHEGGFKNFLRMNLDPEGTIAMLGNRYPITGIGLTRLVEKLIEKGTRDRELGPCLVKVVDGEKVGERKCRLIQVTHPTQEKGMDFHIAQIFFDEERMIPLRYAAFGWPKKEGEAPPLEEEYTYLNVTLNVGMTPEDFSPDNPKYDYP